MASGDVIAVRSADLPVGRTPQPGPFDAELLERGEYAAEVLLDLGRRQQEVGSVLKAMDADQVASGLRLHHQVGVALYVHSLDEERRGYTRAIESLQHSRSPSRVRPVVECQADADRLPARFAGDDGWPGDGRMLSFQTVNGLLPVMRPREQLADRFPRCNRLEQAEQWDRPHGPNGVAARTTKRDRVNRDLDYSSPHERDEPGREQPP